MVSVGLECLLSVVWKFCVIFCLIGLLCCGSFDRLSELRITKSSDRTWFKNFPWRETMDPHWWLMDPPCRLNESYGTGHRLIASIIFTPEDSIETSAVKTVSANFWQVLLLTWSNLWYQSWKSGAQFRCSTKKLTDVVVIHSRDKFTKGKDTFLINGQFTSTVKLYAHYWNYHFVAKETEHSNLSAV